MRVLILKEGEMFIGQCLEHDICVQGSTVDEVMRRFAGTVHLETSERAGSLEDIDPAPPAFHKMWETARRFAEGEDGIEMALAA